MTLYVWRSEAIKQRIRGTIAVEASSIESARQRVLATADSAYWDYECSWRDRKDASDQEAFATWLQLLQQDLSAEPLEPEILWVPGSY